MRSSVSSRESEKNTLRGSAMIWRIVLRGFSEL